MEAFRQHGPMLLSFPHCLISNFRHVSVEAKQERDDAAAHKPISLAARAFHSPSNDDSVIRHLDQHAGLHAREFIIYTKHWRKSLDDESLTWLKSAHIELACLQAVRDVAQGQGFQMTFGRVLTLISRGLENSDLPHVLAVKVLHGHP